MSKVPNGVRPTRRCLADLNVQLPDLGTPLEEIDHPVLAVAQTLPGSVRGGSERLDAARPTARSVTLTNQERECTAGKTVSTSRLLPVEWDWKRLTAEQVVAWRREMKRLVVRLIAMSLTTGQVAVAEFKKHRIKALVRVDNGHETYLAIIAEGIPEPEVFALLLDCVPGVSADDWQPEPSPIAEMEPGSGEIVWSTLFPAEVASAILDLQGTE